MGNTKLYASSHCSYAVLTEFWNFSLFWLKIKNIAQKPFISEKIAVLSKVPYCIKKHKIMACKLIFLSSKN